MLRNQLALTRFRQAGLYAIACIFACILDSFPAIAAGFLASLYCFLTSLLFGLAASASLTASLLVVVTIIQHFTARTHWRWANVALRYFGHAPLLRIGSALTALGLCRGPFGACLLAFLLVALSLALALPFIVALLANLGLGLLRLHALLFAFKARLLHLLTRLLTLGARLGGASLALLGCCGASFLLALTFFGFALFAILFCSLRAILRTLCKSARRSSKAESECRTDEGGNYCSVESGDVHFIPRGCRAREVLLGAQYAAWALNGI